MTPSGASGAQCFLSALALAQFSRWAGSERPRREAVGWEGQHVHGVCYVGGTAECPVGTQAGVSPPASPVLAGFVLICVEHY